MSKKPPIGDIYNLNFPEDKYNPHLLKDVHPGIVVRNNNDDTSEVVGCTGTNRHGTVKVEVDIERNLTKPTYALVSQGERNFENKDLNGNEWKGGTKCTNIQEILDKL